MGVGLTESVEGGLSISRVINIPTNSLVYLANQMRVQLPLPLKVIID